MRIIIIVIFILIAIFINYKNEYFDGDKTIIPNNFKDDDEDLNIKLNKKLIKKMYDMANFISGKDDYEPEIYRDLPRNYKNRHTYIQILYEMYVIDFLDKYIVNRFDAYKFIDVIYKYPSYDDINDKYPNDVIKKNYDRIFNDFLEPCIMYLHKNINLQYVFSVSLIN